MSKRIFFKNRKIIKGRDKDESHKNLSISISPEEFIHDNKDLKKLILQLVISYRVLTWTIPTGTETYDEITEIHHRYCAQRLQNWLNGQTQRLREDTKPIFTKKIRTLINELTQNDMTNQVWTTQLITYLYRNFTWRQTINNYLYYGIYASFSLTFEEIAYTVAMAPMKEQLWRRNYTSKQYLEAKSKKIEDSQIKLRDEISQYRLNHIKEYLGAHVGTHQITKEFSVFSRLTRVPS